MPKREYAITDPRNPGYDAHVRKIVKTIAERLREPDMQERMIEDGKKVALAIKNLQEERRLTPRELNRQADAPLVRDGIIAPRRPY